MKLAITLGDADIKAALVAHAKQALKIDLNDDQVNVEITAGRKGKGYSAEIVIGGDTDTETAPVVTTEASSVGEAVTASEPVNADEELQPVTPETPGHETEAKSSLFE